MGSFVDAKTKLYLRRVPDDELIDMLLEIQKELGEKANQPMYLRPGSTPKQVFEFELMCLQNLIGNEMARRHEEETCP